LDTQLFYTKAFSIFYLIVATLLAIAPPTPLSLIIKELKKGTQPKLFYLLGKIFFNIAENVILQGFQRST
jgi:Na+/H+ antiporter NhaB